MNTKTRIIFTATLFLIFCGVAALIAWVGGFDFNSRNPDVAFHFAITLIASAAASVMIGNTIDL